jgi:4-hydroxymandelate oxidase
MLNCIEHGFGGVQVSNHGGRATETGRATIDTLPEILTAVNGKIPFFVDGGFRRGTDVFKALAMGATAVGIGRQMLRGLGAFGAPGVERVLDIMQRELRYVMGNCGVTSIAQIDKQYTMPAKT